MDNNPYIAKASTTCFAEVFSMLLYPSHSCSLSRSLSRSPMLLYSGGMPRASYGDRHCLTIQQDKEHVTLDFTSRVIDFFTVHSVEREQGWGAPLGLGGIGYTIRVMAGSCEAHVFN